MPGSPIADDLFTEDQFIKYIEKRLREAARRDDAPLIKAILTSDEYKNKIDVNAADPSTGRTALHEACNARADKAARLLKKFGANEALLDKEELSAAELSHIPHPFPSDPKYLENMAAVQAYRRFAVIEANDAMREKKIDGLLVYLDKVAEVEVFIQENPKLNRIGFIVRIPRTIQTTFEAKDSNGELVNNAGHCSAIYYERRDQQETFVQLGTIETDLYLLPCSEAQTRRLFYSPFQRIYGYGCFNDAVALLKTILKIPGLVGFCEQNSKELGSKLFQPLEQVSEIEMAAMIPFMSMMMPSESKGEIQNTQRMMNLRINCQTQAAVYGKKGFVRNIHELTSLPKALLPFVGNYSAMRYFRTRHPEQFSKPMGPSHPGLTLFSFLMKHGKKRNPGASDAHIKANLANPAKEFDFKGIDLGEREKALNQRYKFLSYNTFLLCSKIWTKNVSTLYKRDQWKFANTVNEFVTGQRPLPFEASKLLEPSKLK